MELDVLEERSTVEVFLEYVNLLWHWAWLLVLLAVIAGVTAYFYTGRQPVYYRTSTLIMVTGATSSTSDLNSSIYLGQQLTTTYSQIITTKPVLDTVTQRLGFNCLCLRNFCPAGYQYAAHDDYGHRI